MHEARADPPYDRALSDPSSDQGSSGQMGTKSALSRHTSRGTLVGWSLPLRSILAWGRVWVGSSTSVRLPPCRGSCGGGPVASERPRRAMRASASSWSRSASAAHGSSPPSPPSSRSRRGAFPSSQRACHASTAGGSPIVDRRWVFAGAGLRDQTSRPAVGEKARAAFRRPSIPVASVGFGRGASYLSPASITRGLGRRRRCASPSLGYGDSPVGLGDTPLPAGTSTAGTAGICHVRTTSFPR